MIPARIVLILALAVLAVVPCASASAALPAPPDLASKPPTEILATSAAALRDLRSYRLAGSGTDQDGAISLTGTIAASGSFRVRVVLGSAAATMLHLRRVGTYLRGNRAYWDVASGGEDPRTSRKLADRWLTGRALSGMIKTMGEGLGPKDFAYCLQRAAGTLSTVGTEVYKGQRVVVLEDKGDRPGGTPQRLSIALDGPPYLVRLVQTGPQTAGRIGAARCDASSSDEEDTTTEGELRLSGFDQPTGLRAPRHVLNLDAK